MKLMLLRGNSWLGEGYRFCEVWIFIDVFVILFLVKIFFVILYVVNKGDCLVN